MSSFAPEYDHLFKVLIVGDKNVGKSNLLLRFSDDVYTDSPIASIGVDFKTKIIGLDGKDIKLQVWDVKPPEGIHNGRWLSGAHAYILAFDLSNRESFENIQRWRTELDRHGRSDARVMITGCKADRESERTVSYEEVHAYCKENNIPYIETSSKTGANVEKAFSTLAGECLKQEKLRRPAATGIDARERAPDPAKIKRDLVEELGTRIEVLRSEIGQLLSANKDLKRQKMEALGALREQLLATITPVSQVVHAFRVAHPFLDEGKHSHRTKDLLDKYDTEGPASK